MAEPASPAPSTSPRALRESVLRKSRESAALKEQFFAAEADRIAGCCARAAIQTLTTKASRAR